MVQRILSACILIAVARAGLHDGMLMPHGVSYSIISHEIPTNHLKYVAPFVHQEFSPSAGLHSDQEFQTPTQPPALSSAQYTHMESKDSFNTHPKYSYKYSVSDHKTGDHKSAEEERNGDVVRGSYTLLQPDGVTRTVKYTADNKSGFNAEVIYTGEVRRNTEPSFHESAAQSHYNNFASSFYQQRH